MRAGNLKEEPVRPPTDRADESYREKALTLALQRLGFFDPTEALAMLRGDDERAAAVLDLAQLASRRDAPAGRDPEPTPEEYARWIGDEYLDLNAAALERADMTADQLAASAIVLAEFARMVRAVPPSLQSGMAKPVVSQIKTIAVPHFGRVARSLDETGTLDALEADDYRAMRMARTERLPSIDSELLRKAGYSDPQLALAQAVKLAQTMPDRMQQSARTLADLVSEAQSVLEAPDLLPEAQRRASQGNEAPPRNPRRAGAKRWTGLGKILAGASLAGGNIAVAVTTGAIGAGFEVALPAAFTSTSAGMAKIFEGVGALKGE